MSHNLISTKTHIKQQEILKKYYQENKLLSSEKEYFTESFNLLLTDLMQYFDKDLVLFDAFSLDQSGKVQDIGKRMYKENTKYKELIDNFHPNYHYVIGQLKDNTYNNKDQNSVASISHELIKNNDKTAVCLYKIYNHDQVDLEDCIYLNMSKLYSDIKLENDWTIEDVFNLSLEEENKVANEFCKELGISDRKKRSMLNTVLIYRQLLNDNKSDNIFAYFIGPRVVYGNYNGTLVLLLKRPLIEIEYNILISYLKDILSETVLAKSLEEEWESIVNEQNHTAKHSLKAVGVKINSVLDSENIDNPEKIEDIIIKATSYLNSVNETNDYLLQLMRSKTTNDKKANEILRIYDVDIKTTFFKIIEVLKETLFSLSLSDEEDNEHEALIDTHCIPNLIKSVNKLPSLVIEVSRVGLEIVFLEMLKNALFSTDANKPHVTVSLGNEDIFKGYISLNFINNQGMPLDQYDYLQNKNDSNQVSNRFKSGVRTIKRILNFDRFNKSELRWHYYVSADSKLPNKQTTISLLIPKTDIL